MFSRFLILILSIVFFSQSAISAGREWINFHSAIPQPPEINLLESDNMHVKYQVIVPGMWQTTVMEGDNAYQLLEIEEGVKIDQTGVPSLPQIITKIGVPSGAKLDVIVEGGRQIYLSDYVVAPVPEMTKAFKDGYPDWEFTYIENSNIYGLNEYYPEDAAESRDFGIFITQQVCGISVFPIRFHPQEEKIEVTDTLTLTVNFEGGSGPALQDLGIFGASAFGVLINYTTSPTVPVHTVGNGSVRWVNASETEIDCDYLIVVPDAIWTGLARNAGFDAQVQRFADLRASLSGFDICIVRSATQYGITPTGSIPRGNQDQAQGRFAYTGIRDYVKSVFENGHAYNTGTGKLGFVLLIGAARDEDGYGLDTAQIGLDDWLIPSPRPSDYNNFTWGSDHDYACLTMQDNLYDQLEDVAIGRFPVGNTWELMNMVDKMFTYCASPGDRQWENNILNLAGPQCFHSYAPGMGCQRDFFLNAADMEVANLYNVNLAWGWTNYHPESDPPLPAFTDSHFVWEPPNWDDRLRDIDTAYINTKLRDGSWLFGYFGHGSENAHFCFYAYDPLELFVGFPNAQPPVPPFIQNPDRLHFVIDYSCANAWIDPVVSQMNQSSGGIRPHVTYFDGCSSIALVKSHNGAIGFVGSSRGLSGWEFCTLYEDMIAPIMYLHNGTVGAAYLSYKLNAISGPIDELRCFHYMGDPALDLYSNPVSGDVQTSTTWSGLIIIGQNTSVSSGATLTMAPGSEIVLLNGAVLDIQGRLIAVGTADEPVRIHGMIGHKEGKVQFANSTGDVPWNQLKHCELYALETGVNAINSNISIDSTSITATETAVHQNGGIVDLSGRMVLDSVFVESGTLNIASGSLLLFSNNSRLRSYGTLNAFGEFGDSIRFQGLGETTWAGVFDSSGTINLDYCSVLHAAPYSVYTCYPAGQHVPVSINHTLIDGARIPNGGIALRMWNGSNRVHEVSNSVIQNAQAGNGLYLFNCDVIFENDTIRNCSYVNSYIKKVTGRFRDCTFLGRSSYYSLLMNSTPCVPNFQCCLFQNIAPHEGSFQSSIFCAKGTVPTFGGEGFDYGVSNVIDDSCAYLFTIQGQPPLPIIDYFGSSTPALGGRNDWIQRHSNGKFINWTEMGLGGVTQYRCREQYWVPTANNSMFNPTGFYDYTPYEASAWNLCGGAEVQQLKTPINRGLANRNYNSLDEDEDLLSVALLLEIQHEYDAAQPLFYSVATSSVSSESRWLAASHVVATDVFIRGEISNMIPELIDSLIAADDEYESWVYGNRLLAYHYLNTSCFNQAIDVCLNMFNHGLAYTDSILVSIDIVSIQMAAGIVDGEGELDEMISHVPFQLRVISDKQGLALENDLLSIMGDEKGIAVNHINVPTTYQLHQNYPNPFNPNTEIRFDLPEDIRIELKVFNTLGQLVTTLVDEVRPAGAYTITWNGTSQYGAPVSSGLYIYQLKAGNFVSSRKMILLR